MTTLQLLFQKLDRVGDQQFLTYLKVNRANILELEKEQIIDAGNACSLKTIAHRQELEEMTEDELRNSLVEDVISYGEDYYEQKHGQAGRAFTQDLIPKN